MTEVEKLANAAAKLRRDENIPLPHAVYRVLDEKGIFDDSTRLNLRFEILSYLSKRGAEVKKRNKARALALAK